MTATQKVGGFRPLTPESVPATSSSLAMPNAGPSLHSNNPYLQPSPAGSPWPQTEYPSHDPPSYEFATSPVERERTPQEYCQPPPSDKAMPAQGEQPTRSPIPSQSSQPPQQSSSVMDQAMARLNPRDPLDPPPACFSRVIPPPSSTTTYEPFPQPFVIHAKPGKKFLDEAFATTGTPALYKHDVVAEDWVRLLEDIQIVARLTGGQRVVAGVLPMTMHIGLTGFLVSRAIEKGMKGKNASSVVGLLGAWNDRFFKPRRLEVILCRGDWRVSEGRDKMLPAPDRPNAQANQRRRSNSSSSSSSSSSESDSEMRRGGSPKADRRQMKRERRAERRARRDERRANRDARRAEKRERRSERREQKRGGKDEPYRLVVVSV